MSDIIFNIIPIIISIPAFLVAIKTLKECKNLKCELNKENTKPDGKIKGYINIDEFLYTIEFNTKLDDLIIPKLHKFPNDVIIAEVSRTVFNQWNINPDDINKVEAHVKDILLNYNNKYDEKYTINVKDYINDTLNQVNTISDMPTMIDFDNKENLPSWYKDHKPDGDTRGVTNTEYTKSIDIKNVLNNFYND